MPDILGPWAANIALPAILNRTGLYLALHTLQPSDLTPNEWTGAGYNRQPISFLFGARNALNKGLITFAGLPALTANYLAVWTAISGGFLAFAKDISATPLSPNAGGFIYVPVKDIGLAM